MRRSRLLPGAAALALVLSPVMGPVAQADDPAQEKAQVETQIAEVRGDLTESTAAVAAAAQELEAVDAELVLARDALAAAKGELDVAQAEDQRLAGELASAQAEEIAAEGELVGIQTDIADNQAFMGGLARAAYQGSSLEQVSSAFDAESLESFTRRVQGMRTVMRSQNAALLALGNDRAALATSQAKLEAIRERVAAAKVAAAENVAEKAQLEAAASAAEDQVVALRHERAQVLDDAEVAQAEDEAQYVAL
ncbi:MAG: hypothetical protein M3455_04065, partial [Actinomycetota bacterium]|nr:hypothetical protein [Actinomycetota bacterium]